MANRYEAPTWPSKWTPAGPLDAGLVASLIDHSFNNNSAMPSRRVFTVSHLGMIFAKKAVITGAVIVLLQVTKLMANYIMSCRSERIYSPAVNP